jgi:hypothetical protein
VGSSLASYFAVFHRLLASRLAACMDTSTPQQMLQVRRQPGAAWSEHRQCNCLRVLGLAQDTNQCCRPAGGIFYHQLTCNSCVHPLACCLLTTLVCCRPAD